jgi:hypothetical protein
MSNEKRAFTDAQSLRKNAEKQLKEKEVLASDLVKNADVKRLMHELQVHQIELEMQNDELRLANEATELALKKYTMLYDFATMGYFTIDRSSVIRELNFSGAEMLGDKRIFLVDSNFKVFVAEESLPVFNKFLNEVFSSCAKESCEVTLGYDDNTTCHVYMEGIVTGDDQECLLSVVDISNFK